MDSAHGRRKLLRRGKRVQVCRLVHQRELINQEWTETIIRQWVYYLHQTTSTRKLVLHVRGRCPYLRRLAQVRMVLDLDQLLLDRHQGFLLDDPLCD